MCTSATALFVTCLVDQFFPDVGEASVRLLERCGCRVAFPEAQTCCGQPAFNMGYHEEAAQLARRFIEVFEPYDEVVAPSGSCVSMVRVHFPELLAKDPPWHRRAVKLSERLFELTEYLVRKGFDAGESPCEEMTVTCHDSCHLLRELGVRDASRTLLAQLRGVRVVEMSKPEVCCGFGGAFSAKMPELSGAMLEDKLSDAEQTGAEVLTASDCGCLMHLEGALRRRKSSLRTLHVAEILAPSTGADR